MTISLDSSKQSTLSSHDIKAENSQLQIDFGRSVFGQAFKILSLVEFLSSCQVISSNLVSRKKLTVFLYPLFLARVPAHQILDSIASVSW